MTTCRPFLRLCCASLLGLAAAGVVSLPAAAATATAPKDGAEYLTLPSPLPTDAGRKVEVIEFFAWYCPHCYALAPQQRLIFTLGAMGLTEKFHDKVFGAMHVERLRLNSDEQVMDYLVGKARQ